MGGEVLPEERLPQCWADDVRMNALFAPFRLKTVNPESWEMKMKFWSDMLEQWCRWKGDAIVTAADARVAFQRKGRTPACIDIVIEEMFRCVVFQFTFHYYSNQTSLLPLSLISLLFFIEILFILFQMHKVNNSNFIMSCIVFYVVSTYLIRP